ncbi:MAG TPA: DedA family protein [Candidatus Paceibacterota bacterium]|jgi:membrane protein DedA with SNARE-associated domain|nr:DedA family protein [Candidatus Paceibacterota bacterium]HQB56936.1 DedA family protein [Candidatus Paceibacterota bacterium]
MEIFITNIMNQFGYWGMLFLIFIENIFPPIPSEIILPLGGFVTTLEKSKVTVFGLIIFATLGSIFGAFILYWIGTLLNVNKLETWLEKKWIKRLGFKKNEVEKTVKFFEKWEGVAVFFGRCVPIVRSLISIPAGMVKMNLLKFTLYTAFGSLIWNTLLISAGAFLGENWRNVVTLVDEYKNIVLIILSAVTIILIWRYFKKRNSTNK